jgi:AraC-like DNA-binding protein
LEHFVRSPKIDELRTYIHTFWINRHSKEEVFGESKPKLPPQPSSNLIFNFGTPYKKEQQGGLGNSVKSHIKGPNLHYYEINHTGIIDILGIAFQPFGLYAFTNYPIRNLINKVAAIESVDSFFVGMYERLLEIDSDVERIEFLEEALLTKLNYRKRYLDSLISFVDIVEAQRNNINLGEIAQSLGMSLKTLERRCLEVIGITPKSYIRLVRYNHALETVRTDKSGRNWIDIATECGYYDQSHFIREFKQLTGDSPEKYRTIRDLIGDFI